MGIAKKIGIAAGAAVVGFFVLGFAVSRDDAAARNHCESLVKMNLLNPEKTSFAKETISRTDRLFEISSGVYYTGMDGSEKYAKYSCTYDMSGEKPELQMICVDGVCKH